MKLNQKFEVSEEFSVETYRYNAMNAAAVLCDASFTRCALVVFPWRFEQDEEIEPIPVAAADPIRALVTAPSGAALRTNMAFAEWLYHISDPRLEDAQEIFGAPFGLSVLREVTRLLWHFDPTSVSDLNISSGILHAQNVGPASGLRLHLPTRDVTAIVMQLCPTVHATVHPRFPAYRTDV